MAENASSVFRTLRVVRRVPGGEETMTVAGLLNNLALAATNPVSFALLVAALSLTAFSKISSYIVAGQFILPDIQEEALGITYSDQLHRNLLQRIYGRVEGTNLFNKMISDRQTEIDLRGKLP